VCVCVGTNGVQMPFHASGDLCFQRREIEAKINQAEAALEALRASNDDSTSHSKKWPAEVSASGLEVVPLAIHLVSKAALTG
jgi:hypothetical protein